MCRFVSDPSVPIPSFLGAIFYHLGFFFFGTNIGIYYSNRGKAVYHARMLPVFSELGNFIFHKMYLNVLT